MKSSFAAVLVLVSLAAATASAQEYVYAQSPEVIIHEEAGAHHPAKLVVDKGQRLRVEDRLEPGRHRRATKMAGDLFGPGDAEVEYEWFELEETWLFVVVPGSDGWGWVRAADVEQSAAVPDYGDLVEHGAVIHEDLSPDHLRALMVIVQLYGYRCDTVSSARPFLFSVGFTLRCNYHRYSYEIEDRGGQWVVVLD